MVALGIFSFMSLMYVPGMVLFVTSALSYLKVAPEEHRNVYMESKVLMRYFRVNKTRFLTFFGIVTLMMGMAWMVTAPEGTQFFFMDPLGFGLAILFIIAHDYFEYLERGFRYLERNKDAEAERNKWL